MSTIPSHDLLRPLKAPSLPLELLSTARKMHLHIYHIICDEPNAKVKDFAGVSFWIAGAWIPREGELFCLEDGTVCKVKAVTFNVGRFKG